MSLPVGTAYQLVGAKSDATALTNLTLAGTTNEININQAGTTITLSLATPLAVTKGGTGVTTSTGSGNNVLSTSPTLVTPILGTPTSGALTNCTSIPVNQATGTLAVLNGGTGVTTSTGSGNNVLSTSPTLVTPVLGAATATSINFGQTTLSTYQEGTFTPAVKFGGNSVGVTYGTQSGSYTRIGRMVQFQVDIILTSKGSSTGQFTITGAPFAAATRAYSSMMSSAMTATYTNLIAELDTTTWFPSYSSGGALTGLTEANVTNTTTLRFTGTYFV